MRKRIYFGIIGLGLMGKEFAGAVARWCHLLDDGPVPVIRGICHRSRKSVPWFVDNFPSIEIVTDDYRDLLNSDRIDAIYCAVPHYLHEQFYIDIIEAGKHLLGEKPFGIDREANARIVRAAEEHGDLVVKCSSQWPYYPGAKMVIDWLRERKYGRIMEVRAGFLHSSDMDLTKPINWKRIVEMNGEYGCMGDLGFHVQFIPLRMGWKPISVYADLQNIARTRPDDQGGMVPCETWDNATVICRCVDQDGEEFPLFMETKRMAPGQTNTWFIEVFGTKGSVRFSTRDPRSFYYLETSGREQGWTRLDIGSISFIPTITGSIFEFGFSDAMLQMLGAFMQEFRDEGSNHPFPNASPAETALSHRILTAALESHKTGRRIDLTQERETQ